MEKYTFESLSHLGQLYREDGEEFNPPSGTAVYLATEVEDMTVRLLAAKNGRIAELEKALGNCRLLAMKRLHKGAIEKADWETILRFCTEAGCGPSPLRDDS